MDNINYGYFDESGNIGKQGDYYIIACVLFHKREDSLKAKVILKREKKIINL